MVSILTSNYNYSAYIGQAIESILNQDYDQYELIICDDGSTDDSARIVKDYCQKDPRIRLIEKNNGGQASAWNMAFQTSTGELILFLDADDVFYPDKISSVVKAHQKDSAAGFGIHQVQRVNKQRRPRGVWPHASLLPGGWCGLQMLTDGGVLSYMPPASGLSLHRSVAAQIFPLPESYPLTTVADQVITRFAPLLTCVLSIHKILAEHRLHGANSYGRSRVTAETISREITICRELWGSQHRFLDNISPDLASRLQPLERSPYLIYLDYLHARLSRSPAVASYRRYISNVKSNPNARAVWFWKCSIHLPAFLFDSIINFMCGQHIFKEVIARFRQAV